ncbi:general substrate transporter [Polychaeton citri CBS 116435]|uniref:General substrate transporter n=1 Tax=Polychaeton citri CBS 116435 TaxID=1314669 RepID=A0A9P4UQ10_9PEZI|nr:general substrate transporter [Polychaeton citri CBS 116435]
MIQACEIKQNAKRILRCVAHPQQYFVAALWISIGGFLNGYDTGSIGAITDMPTFQSGIAFLSPTLRGLTVSLLLLAGAIPSLFAGLLADKYGHLAIVLTGAIFFTVGAVLEAGTMNLAMLLVGRSLVGIGEGLYLGNLNVYICEIAPKTRRGMLVAMPQLFVTAGTCCGYFTCYGTIKIDSEMQWRIPFIIQAVGGAILAVVCCLLPESPRWLLVRAKRDVAIRNLERLDLPQSELLNESDELNLEDPNTNASGPSDRLTLQPIFSKSAVLDLFRKQYRFRTVLALFILGMVQLCGIDGVLYYAPMLFAQAGLPGATASFVASGVSGTLMFAISIPAFLMADKYGRRTIVVFGGVLLAGCMVLIGGLYASGSVSADGGAGRWVVIVLIFVFALSYVSTWGIVGKIYASEIQPAHNRATANALAQALNFFTNFLTAIITPIFLARSSSGPYFLFAGLTALTLVVLWLWMPETRARSLESIQETFTPPMTSVWRKAKSSIRQRVRPSSTNGSHESIQHMGQASTGIELS